jgi:hypothetical protein
MVNLLKEKLTANEIRCHRYDCITTMCRPSYIPAMHRIHGGPLLSVLAAALHLPIVGTWRTRKALGVPYGIAYRRWERKRSQIAKKYTATALCVGADL